MFCVKCGSEVLCTDEKCQKCGANNENYQESVSKKKIRKQEQTTENHNTKKVNKKLMCGISIGLLLVAVIIVVSHSIKSVFQNYTGSQYIPTGITAIIDKEGQANFYFNDGNIKTFEGDFQEGRSTPDQSQFILLGYDGNLLIANQGSEEPKVIANNVQEIVKVTDEGCSYIVDDKISVDEIIVRISENPRTDKTLNQLNKEFEDLYVHNIGNAKKFYHDKMGYQYSRISASVKMNIYNFATEKNVNIDSNIREYLFADNSLTMISVNLSGKLSLYSSESNEIKELCDVGNKVNLGGVSDDGTKIIWMEEKNDDFMIYMMKDSVPERIGKLGKTQKYMLLPYVTFFEDGFIIRGADYNNIIFSYKDMIQTVALSGVLDSVIFVDDKGREVNNNSIKLKYLYFMTKKNKDGNISRLYKLELDGSVKEIISDLNQQYFIRNNNLFYINAENDFYVAQIKKEGISNLKQVTTEVDKIFLSKNGQFAFIAKSNGLYYWKTSDKEFKINQICSDFSEDSDLYLTENEKILFLITDKQDIEESFFNRGTLYSYDIEKQEKLEIGKNVISLRKNDAEFISSQKPIIVQYEKMDENKNILLNFGILEENQIKMWLNEVKF